jgi:CIC family chloride channel protein
MPTRIILGILIVKSTIWAVSLGSGTSGGVLAPLLMIGGALGGIEAQFLPWEGVGFWPLVSMGAILGGTMRSPLTAVIFAFELTHDVNIMLPLLLAVTIAHGFTVLLLRRSILTEKVSRRGYHLSREYAIDPLEIIFAREVMRTSVVALSADADAERVAQILGDGRGSSNRERLFPVVGESRRLVGVATRRDLRQWLSAAPGERRPLAETIARAPIVAYDDDPLRLVVFRMAETGLTRFPVVARADGSLIGMIGLNDLLTARARILEAEHRRERTLGTRLRLLDVLGPGRAA